MFAKDSEMLATSGRGSEVVLWAASSGKPTLSLGSAMSVLFNSAVNAQPGAQ
eukprot:CAMPEP_0197647316 /NCGR_PEP_ID=MMETSP1338-20131121/24910_1 /TAXON_ID=43686 ORGANISM="Pelagodinium beii, Strain RCC1491" /NCGR_SAMPLE_ID=MMETSP1338 /ASSEMBLY_ACC=CAM_ASM_000754 /LENGTH=51 /DNA_ID=CAMNT_0043221087 /DNA_START=361 /DNA_END=516 /DNA_ORIENTATION=+